LRDQQGQRFGLHRANERGCMPNQECTTLDPAQLAVQARTAYEKKRIRECLELTKALESADPGNKEAQSLMASIQADMRRDLEDVRALIALASGDDGTKYRRAAELILLKLLRLDPQNEDAKALMQTVRPGATVATSTTARRVDSPRVEPAPAKPIVQEVPKRDLTSEYESEFQAKSEHQPETELHFEPVYETVKGPEAHSETFRPTPSLANSFPVHTKHEDVPFTAVLLETKDEKPSRKIPIGLIAMIALAVGIFFVVQSRRSAQKAAATAAQTQPVQKSDFPPSSNTQKPATPTASPIAAAVPAKPTTATPPPPVPTPVTPPVNQPVPAATVGKLAVSSPTAAEIYIGNKYVGSTPTTLELPAGRQTIEYRHGDLRTTVSHDIKANQTITASVTFQMTVQVNAKPWAQVFLDGSPRRALGQTPLSGITVPIGGVLIFENPSFATKSYRITDKDTAIQVDFQ
jgi:hypothetical protein